jgi:hypothetical protein
MKKLGASAPFDDPYEDICWLPYTTPRPDGRDFFAAATQYHERESVSLD